MSQPQERDPSFEFIWGQYRCWSVTSQNLKRELTTWRWAVLALTILGAFTAILGQHISSEGVASKITGWVSAGAVGIAGYAGSKILSGEKEKQWLQARAAAESCKSNALLYLLKVSPYNQKENDAHLYRIIENLIKSLYTIPLATLSAQEQLKNIPATSYSFDDYVNERIVAQAKEYYFPKAGRYRKFLKRAGHGGMALGAAGFLLGTLSSDGTNTHMAVWIAFVSTVSASLTSFMAASRYQYLAMSFQATGNQLMVLGIKSKQIDRTDAEAQKNLIMNCEEILATENEAWMTELSKQEGHDEAAPAIRSASYGNQETPIN